MKQLFTAVLILLCFHSFSQTVDDVNDLISHSSEIPSDSLKLKCPVFYQVFQNEKNNDNLIKDVFFVTGVNTKGVAVVKNSNLIFINESYMLHNTGFNLEDKAIADFYRCIGFIHSGSVGFNKVGDDMTTKRETYVCGFILNKSIGVNNCDYIKYLLAEIKIRSLSEAKPVADGATAVLNMPQYQQYVKYSNSCAITDMPTEKFILPEADNNSQPQKPVQQQQQQHAQAPPISHSYNSQASLSPLASKTPGLTDLIEKHDDMLGVTTYIDPRTPDHLHGNGMYANIILNKAGEYILRFTVYHVVVGAVMINGFSSGGEAPEDVTGVLVKTTDTLFTFENPKTILGNGSRFPHISIIGTGFDKNNFAYKVLSRIIATNYCKVRFESSPQISDYELSNREIDEIRTVVKAWLTVNHIE